jgi:hypothetical protein
MMVGAQVVTQTRHFQASQQFFRRRLLPTPTQRRTPRNLRVRVRSRPRLVASSLGRQPGAVGAVPCVNEAAAVKTRPVPVALI